MTSAGLALQKAIYETLIADAALAAALDGVKVYDEVPRGAAMPYVAIALSSARDWSTASEDGEEHTVTLHVWSDHAGLAETQAIVATIRAALHDQALALDGHRLVNLRHEQTETRRQPERDAVRGLIRLRAVTEPTA